MEHEAKTRRAARAPQLQEPAGQRKQPASYRCHVLEQVHVASDHALQFELCPTLALGINVDTVLEQLQVVVVALHEFDLILERLGLAQVYGP